MLLVDQSSSASRNLPGVAQYIHFACGRNEVIRRETALTSTLEHSGLEEWKREQPPRSARASRRHSFDLSVSTIRTAHPVCHRSTAEGRARR
jgi:hypothetical protein